MQTKIIFTLLLTLLLYATNMQAQVPEKIYGKNKVMKPNEYYIQQLGLWKKEVDSNPKNANAWFNYYRASRNAYIKGEEDNSQKSKGNSRFIRLQNIVLEMEKQVPESFEYNFAKWLNGNNDQSLFPYLEKAHQLSLNNPEPIMSLIFYYELKGDYNKRNTYIEMYYTLGDYSPGLLNYSYNLLSGLSQNAILFTEGDKDTEGILLLQNGKKYRMDIQLLNVNLLLIDEYRERIFNELKIPQLTFKPLESDINYERFQKQIIEHIAKNKPERPIYSAVTVSSPYRANITNNLKLTGLAYLYTTSAINNIEILKKNIEEIYLLDYLIEYFPKDISVGNVNSMNENYLLSFAELNKHYTQMGNFDKANYYKTLSLKIAIAAEQQEMYNVLFNSN